MSTPTADYRGVKEGRAAERNRLLLAIPADEYRPSEPLLEPLHIPVGHVIYEPGAGREARMSAGY
jgi:hypothetical protein